MKAIANRENRILQAVVRTIKIESHFVETEARQFAPSKTGTMRALIHAKPTPVVTETEVKTTVQGGIGYTPYQEFGTGPKGAASGYLPASAYSGPYVIEPGPGKRALYWKGAAHPVKRVVHYGVKAKKFFKRAVDKMRPRMRAALVKAMSLQ